MGWFLPSAKLAQEISLRTSDIVHGRFACSEQFILIYEPYVFALYDINGRKIGQLSWERDDYNRFGYVGRIVWSAHLNAFLVLSHRALFTLEYNNREMIKTRKGAVFAPNKQPESRLRFIACGSNNDYLFLNRGYHTIQQYKMTTWTRYREWTKQSLNYAEVDEIHDTTTDRNGEYLVMNVRESGTTWLIDARSIDKDLTHMRRISGFHHKLQLLSPCNHWLFLRGDPNKLFLYDVKGDNAQIPKEVFFGNNEDDPQFSFSKTAPISFRWMDERHLVLGTILDNDQGGILKVYTV